MHRAACILLNTQPEPFDYPAKPGLPMARNRYPSTSSGYRSRALSLSKGTERYLNLMSLALNSNGCILRITAYRKGR